MHKSIYSLRNYKKEVILGPIFKTLEVIFELLIPFLMKGIIDVGITNYNQGLGNNDILWRSGLIILLCVIGFCSTMVCQYFASIASQGFGTDLRNRIIKKIDELSLKELKIIGDGNLINLINNDSNRLQQSVAMLIRLAIRAPAMVLGSLVCAFLIDYKVGLILLIVIVLISLILFFVLKTNNKKVAILQKKNDEIATTIKDGLNGARVIRSFNDQKYEENRCKKETQDYFKDSKKVSFINALINPLTYLIINSAIFLIISFWNGQLMNSFSTLSRGDIVAILQYLNQILLALIALCNILIIFNKGLVSKKRCDYFLTLNSSIKNNPIVSKHDIGKGEELFKLKNVDFCYNSGDNLVLKDINLVINKGDKVGIIGGTGSGKTTLIRLLERFYDTNKGKLFYKGNDIKDYDVDSLHEEISYISQKNNLFIGTIKSNLEVGKNNATNEEIIESLNSAVAYDFVNEYKDGINHKVEENGKNFSGGQKQRICIARGLIKDSETLILDDTMSALDFLTEKKLRQNIYKNKNKTIIVVSQRVSSLANCNKIIVMHNGQIDSIGTNKYLLENSKIYKEIYSSQVKNK
ncbi:MAG: ABC transporter ATP-binding protein [Bacilli bacterium]